MCVYICTIQYNTISIHAIMYSAVQQSKLNLLVCVEDRRRGWTGEVGLCIERRDLLACRSQHAVPHDLGHQLVHEQGRMEAVQLHGKNKLSFQITPARAQ